MTNYKINKALSLYYNLMEEHVIPEKLVGDMHIKENLLILKLYDGRVIEKKIRNNE